MRVRDRVRVGAVVERAAEELQADDAEDGEEEEAEQEDLPRARARA